VLARDSPDAVRQIVASLVRTETPKLVGVLTRILGDVARAEELTQDALITALTEWPVRGVPERPGAWLMTAAKHRALNAIRHRRVEARAPEDELDSHLPLAAVEAALEAGMDQDVADDVLRLIFTACHPVLSRDAQVALTLRLIGGLSTEAIARAFLTTEAALAQRIVRAKRTLSEARVPFEIPAGDALSERLGAVLEVVYLIFNEGYYASAGDDVLRPALVDEAMRLATLLAALAPREPEVLGLLALIELNASRSPARTDAEGEPVLLAFQERQRWDQGRIARGLHTLDRARTLAHAPGPYELQAAIAACHARARTFEATDWTQIAALYLGLEILRPSPVVALNRAVAISRADSPKAGLLLLDALASEPSLARYHLLPSARADLLERLGRLPEARRAFELAASLTDNARQRERLLARARACATST